jgi:hypothetical protein
MSEFVSALRAVAIAALVGGYAWTCPATASADSNSAALAGMLSKGYSTSNCKSIDERDPELQSRGILANYDCGSNPLPGGPTKAVYMLFDTSNETANWFTKFTSTLTAIPCASDDPHSWHKPNSPDSTGGKLACGGGSTVAFVWTNDQNRMGAILIGADAKSLYQWWRTNG